MRVNTYLADKTLNVPPHFRLRPDMVVLNCSIYIQLIYFIHEPYTEFRYIRHLLGKATRMLAMRDTVEDQLGTGL